MIKPAEGLCPVCNNFFKFKSRSQGGGRRRIYCSNRCRSLDWIRGNGGKRKTSITKYDDKPESKLKKQRRQRKTTLAKYGWTEDQFTQQLTTQGHRCLGCLRPLTTASARIDHCHATNKVRGLLCDGCNWALGHVRDSIATLQRLIEHLK